VGTEIIVSYFILESPDKTSAFIGDQANLGLVIEISPVVVHPDRYDVT